MNEERPRLGGEPGPFCGPFGAPPTSAVRADVRYLRPRRTDQVLPTPDQSHGHLTRSEKVSVLAVASVPSRTLPRDAPRGCGASTWLPSAELRNSVATRLSGVQRSCSSPATRFGRWVSPSPARALHDRAGCGPSSPAAWSTSAEPSPLTHHLAVRLLLDVAGPAAPAARAAGFLCGSTSAWLTARGLMARARSGCPCGAPGRERPTPDHPEPAPASVAGALLIRVPRRDAVDRVRTDRQRARRTRPDAAGPAGPAQAASEICGLGRTGRTRRVRPPAAGAAGGRHLDTTHRHHTAGTPDRDGLRAAEPAAVRCVVAGRARTCPGVTGAASDRGTRS